MMMALILFMNLFKRKTAVSENDIDYRSIFQNAVEGIFLTTPEGRYIACNDALAQIYGYNNADELINSVTDIAHQLYLDPNKRFEFRSMIDKNGMLIDFEAEIRKKDGSTAWIKEDVRSVYDEDGKLLYYEGFVSDISVIRYSEDLIIRQNKELQELNDTLEKKVERRTLKLQQKNETIEAQNEELKNILNELTKIKLTSTATTITIIITVALFLLSEGFLEPIIEDNLTEYEYTGFALKGIIALLIKPIEFLVERILLTKGKYKTILNS